MVQWKKIKIQKRWLLGRLSDGSFVQSLYVYFCRSFLLCRLLGLQVTGRGLAFVAAIEARQPKLVQKFNSSTTVEPMFVSRHNAKPMLPAVLFVSLYVPSYAVQYSTVISYFVTFDSLNVLSCKYCF